MTLRYKIKKTLESPTYWDYPLDPYEQLRKDVLASEEQIFILCDDPALRYGRAWRKQRCNEFAEIVNAVLILSSSTNRIGLSKHSRGANPIA